MRLGVRLGKKKLELIFRTRFEIDVLKIVWLFYIVVLFMGKGWGKCWGGNY